MSAPFPPSVALARATALLSRHGFATLARNERGDTLYLAPPDCPFRLRVSNHARSPGQRRRRSDVLTSLVLSGPRSEAQLARMVEQAVRDLAAARARREDQASGAGSRR